MKLNYSYMVLGKTSITTHNQPSTFYFNKATHDYANHFNY